MDRREEKILAIWMNRWIDGWMERGKDRQWTDDKWIERWMGGRLLNK